MISFVLPFFTFTFLVTQVQALGPKIDSATCHHAHPGITFDMVEQMLDEAFDMAANAAKLADTPSNYLRWRIFDSFQIFLGKGQQSVDANLAKDSLKELP